MMSFMKNVTDWQCGYTAEDSSLLMVRGEAEGGLQMHWEWPTNHGKTSLPSHRAIQQQHPHVLG